MSTSRHSGPENPEDQGNDGRGQHSREGTAESAVPSLASIAVLIVAAGQGTRLGAGVPKALAPLAGEALIVHAVRGALAALPDAQLVVVEPPGDERLRAAVAESLGCRVADSLQWVPGGAERTDSVRAGLSAAESELILVHDCARALTPPSVYRRVVAALQNGADGAIPAVDVVDTIKVAAADGVHIDSTPKRSSLRAVQTPQGFRRDALLRAHSAAEPMGAAATDDSMLLEALGLDVCLVQGDPRALKVTGPLDLLLADYWLAHPETEQTLQGQP